MPGGGFVLIYSDITERKRAEQAIRTARDTAEKALRELQATQASLLHAQKMAALGQMTAGIAHEIKNPLNFVNNFAGLSIELLDELKTAASPTIDALDDNRRVEMEETLGTLTRNLAKIVEHGQRADGIVKSMLAHSRDTSGERQRVDINALVEELLNLAYHGARAQDRNFNITLERDYKAATKPIELVPQNITRVLLNLFANGFYAAHKQREKLGATTFEPTLWVTTRECDDAVEIAVRDNGIGIASEDRDKLFQPFFTTKPSGEVPGLACRSATTLFRRSTEARSRSIADLANSPSSQSACHVSGRPSPRDDSHEHFSEIASRRLRNDEQKPVIARSPRVPRFARPEDQAPRRSNLRAHRAPEWGGGRREL